MILNEFKGTKGKWKVNGNGVIIDDYNRGIYLDYSCGGFGIEREYNALLISKAPEMLEMLQRIESILTYDTIEPNSPLQEDIYNLIKQATEL